MLSREQSITLWMVNNRRWENNNPMGWLPREIAAHIINIEYEQDPKSDIAIALGLAASGQEEDLVALTEMIQKNPRILLQAGNVVTRGGFFATRKTLSAFFLGEGDPMGAKRIKFGFAEIPDGEKVRIYQYEEYRPHIEALAKQMELKIPAYDLTPLFDIITQTKDITAALNDENSALSEALRQFKKAIRVKSKVGGMHYKHYTTLMQALYLLKDRWLELTNNYQNFDKCDFIWLKVIGGLQIYLPAPDRFGFSRAFEDEERTVRYKYAEGSFPNAADNMHADSGGVGSDVAIFGMRAELSSESECVLEPVRQHMLIKNAKLADLIPPKDKYPTCVIF